MKKKMLLLLLSVLIFPICGCTNTENKIIPVGEWQDKTYVNNFANLALAVPTDWAICTSNEIDEMLVEKSETLHCDAMAKSGDMKKNIFFMFEKVPENTNLTEIEYLTKVKDQFGRTQQVDGVLQQISNARTSRLDETLIGGQKYCVLSTELSGLQVKQDYYVRKVGDYFTIILCTAAGEGNFIDFIK